MFKTTIVIAILLVATYGQNSESDEKDCNCVSPQYCKTVNGTVFPIEYRSFLNEEDADTCEKKMMTCCLLQDILSYPVDDLNPLPLKKCGGRNANGIIIKLVNQNLESQFGEFPWMIEISETKPGRGNFLKKAYIYLAGGSLIHPSVVLTAAHKVHNKDITNLRIRAGEWDQNSRNEPLPHQDRNVERIIKHDQFNSVTGANSLALLFLNEPFKIEKHINTVCLPPPGTSFDNARCFVAGWGTDARTNGANRLNILKKIDLPVVPHNDCQRMLRKAVSNRYSLHPNLLCAGGEEGKDTCNGDGGSPLVCPIDNEEGIYYQAGIVVGSVGGCGLAEVPGLYSKIANFIDWINNHIPNTEIVRKSGNGAD